MVAQKLDQPDAAMKTADLLLYTLNHMQAIQIKRKEREPSGTDPGGSYFAATRYDGNVTGNHRRWTFAEPTELKAYSSVRDQENGEMAVLCRDVSLNLPPEALGSPLNAGSLGLGMRMMMDDVYEAVSHRAGEMSATELRDCLNLKAGVHPILQIASDLSSHRAVGAFLGIIEAAARRLELNADELTGVLEARGPDQMPVLHAMLGSGRPEQARAFGMTLSRLDLPRESLVRLLRAEGPPQGVPGLLIAAERGHTSTVHAYAEALSTLSGKLTAEDRIALLDARSPDGRSAADVALGSGHQQTHDAIIALRSLARRMEASADDDAKPAARDDVERPAKRARRW